MLSNHLDKNDNKKIDDFIKSLNKRYFIDYLNAQEEIKQSFKSIICGKNYEDQLETIGELFLKVEEKTHHKIVGKVLKGFAKIQTSLFGIELEEKEGKRYRDHFIHTFNVYIFGSIIISQLIKKINNDNIISSFLKIKKERDDIHEAFSIPITPYDIERRLFFIWTFIVLYHDVGVPIEHLEIIRNRLNIFFDNFGFVLHEFFAEFQDSIISRLDYFMNLLTKMCIPDKNVKGIKFDNESYKLSSVVDPHIKNIFLKAFNEKNHGVISAICFYKCTIDILSKIGGDCKKYRKWILEQDITRIALAIALHDLYKYDKTNSQSLKSPDKNIIFPISFNDFPFTFLLILMDQTQEYFRPEGISLNKVTKITELPEIRIERTSDHRLKFKINIKLLYSKLPDDIVDMIINDFKNFKYNKILQSNSAIDNILTELNNLNEIKTFKDVIKSYWEEIEKNIRNRLKFGVDEPICFQLKIKLDNKTIKKIDFN